MILTVLSALARQNVDPWQESAILTDLPKEIATRRLASLIDKLPVGQSGKLDEWAIARRLVALLPPAGSNATARRSESLEFGSIRDPQVAMLMFFVVSVLVALSINANHQAQARADTTPAAISGNYSSNMLHLH